MSRADVVAHAEEETASPVLGVIARCYTAYEDALRDEGLYDDADVLRWGTEALAGGAPAQVSEAVFAVLGAAELSEREAEFLRAVERAGHAFYCIGEREGASNAPGACAAARFRAAPFPEGAGAQENGRIAGRTDGPGETTVCRAVGAENEVRAAFQRILASEVAFDEVEIALAQRRPYRSLVADVAEQAGIEVTFSTGRPAPQTRTGQALRGLYQWIQHDFDPALLVRLLRSGLVRVTRAARGLDGESEWSGPALATWLAGRRYEPGRVGYGRAFTLAEEDLEQEIGRLEEKEIDAEREKEKLRRTRAARRVVTDLIGLIPQGTTSAADMARMSQRFLERFGPVDAADHVPEEERSPEEAARGVLYQKLGNLRRMPVTYEASCRHLAGMLDDMLEWQYVRSARSRAGAVHAVPLERAAFTGRPHLYVLGLDRDAFSQPEADPLPFEPEHRDGRNRDEAAERPDDAAETAEWLARHALRRHAGPMHLFASTYDVENGEERFPSAFFLEEEKRQGGEASLACFQPHLNGHAAQQEHLLIDERAAWLAAHAGRRSHPEKGRVGAVSAAKSARAVACARYPWLESAASARAARAADEYTLHDGLLGDGPFPELDFTASDYEGPPLSAGRLETLAETPYLYFLKYVLGARPLDEPALDEAGWLDPLRRGSVLHDAFERFMTHRPSDRAVQLEEEEALDEALRDVLSDLKRRHAPPSERVEAAALRRLGTDARAFLYAEVSRKGATPWAHELGFGYGPRRARDGDLGRADVSFGDALSVRLRGRIDRIDRLESGALAIWDYKTGSARGYDQSAPLADGAHLQWALYAYVLQALTGETVNTSGYFFTSAKEMGTRLSCSPARYRDEVGEIIARLGAMARAGRFPMNPKACDLGAWTWSGYAALVPDLKERAREMKTKAENDTDDEPLPLYL